MIAERESHDFSHGRRSTGQPVGKPPALTPRGYDGSLRPARTVSCRGERLAALRIPEIGVSGKLPLSKRPGLLAAIEMIVAGHVGSVRETSCVNPRAR
jgi:hypothetical protein